MILDWRRAVTVAPRASLLVLLVAIATLVRVAPVAADESQEGAEAEGLLGAIEVRAAPEPESGVRDESAFATTIPVREQPAEMKTLTDVLSEAPGVQVRRFGGLGDFATVSIRGSSPAQVGVFLDGVPLSRARSEIVNLADLPLDQLDRVEIYRGFSPLALSSSALAGAVNLVTRDPGPEPRVGVLAGGGSFGTRKASAAASGGRGALSGLLSFSYLGSDGDFEFLDDNGTLQNPNDDRETERRNNAFDSGEMLGKLRWVRDDHTTLTFLSDLYLNRQGVPGIGAFQSDDASLRDLRSVSYLRLERQGIAGVPLHLTSTGSFVFQRERFRDVEGEIGVGNVATDNRTYSGLLENLVTGVWGRHAFDLRLDLGGEVFTPEDTLATDPTGPDQTRLRFDLAAGDTIGLLGDRVLVQPSLRWEHLHDDIGGPMGRGTLAASDPETRDHDLVTPRLGLRWDARPWLAVKANVGRNERAPSFSELFGNRGSIRGNPELVPERALNADLGIDVRRERIGPLAALRFEAVGFASTVDDLIVLVQNSQRTAIFRNVDRARSYGVETSLATRVGEYVRARATYTYEVAHDESGLAGRDGNVLPGRPKHDLYARTELGGDGGRLFYELAFIAENFLDQANFLLVNSRAVHTIGVDANVAALGRRFGSPRLAGVPLALTVEVRNVTDNQVEDVAGFPLPGRSFFATVRWQFAGAKRESG